MLTRLAQKYKITCDRCGKEHVREEGVMDDVDFHYVTISNENGRIGACDLCEDCYKEICEFVENFFDEVNKTEGADE